jgi:hypothetical protein
MMITARQTSRAIIAVDIIEKIMITFLETLLLTLRAFSAEVASSLTLEVTVAVTVAKVQKKKSQKSKKHKLKYTHINSFIYLKKKKKFYFDRQSIRRVYIAK